MIVSVARKISSDPNQEKLRKQKDVWNKEVSTFIEELKSFKKLMNGFPSKFHMEKSKIFEPIPANPGSILQQLASVFEKITMHGNEIVSQQLDYSQTRKKKQPKQSNTNISTVPDLSQQLSNASDELDTLIVEASNPLSRFLSQFKGTWFGSSLEAKKRRYRLSMLASTLALFKLCSKFQIEVLRSKKSSIDDANRLLAEIEDSLLKMSVNIKSFSNDLNIKPSETSGSPLSSTPSDNDKNKVAQAEQAIQDFSKNMLQISDANPNLIHNMRAWQIKFKDAEKQEQKLSLVPDVLNAYKELIIDLCAKRGISANTISEITEKTLKTANAKINILAQETMKKWLGKARHSSNLLNDETSSSRLIAFESAENMRSALERIMNSLERDFDVDYLIKSLDEVYSNFFKIKDIFSGLLPGLIMSDPSTFKTQHQKKLQDLIEKKRLTQLTQRLYSEDKKKK